MGGLLPFPASARLRAPPAKVDIRRGAGDPVIPSRLNRKRSIRYDKRRYKDRHLIENSLCYLRDFRRSATRYDKLARNFQSAVALATVIAFWI